jgi:hypothetical protein
MTFRKRFWLVLILCLLLAAAVGCAEKSSGDDDDDDDDNDTTDGPPESGVGSYAIHLNMVETIVGQTVEPAAADVVGLDDPVEAIGVADYLDAIEPFAPDAANFTYRFFGPLEAVQLGDFSLTELADAVFYEDAEAAALCLGWLTDGHDDDVACGLEGGWVVTLPVAGAFEMRTLEYVNERSGETPAHLSETVALQAVAHTGANTVVSGTYLKTYLQQDGWGVKVFADAGATETSQGYDGSLIVGIETFIGDEVFVLGRITGHDGMIEFVPQSAYHVAVLSIGNDVEAPATVTIADLIADRFRYAGALVRVDDLAIVEVNPDDPTTDWPDYGLKSKEISIRHTAGGAKLVLPVYENTGLPGSPKPADGFNTVGAFEVSGASNQLFPRRVEDINPSDETLDGVVRVTVEGEGLNQAVQLSGLATGLQPLGDGGALVPVVSLASVVRAAGLTRGPRAMTFKPVAYDDRQPFDTAMWEEIKSGVLYQSEPENDDQPDPMVNSYFWEQMGLSDIYFLNGITKIAGFRAIAPPEEGDATYGEGVTLMINGHSFNIEFAGIAKTEYDGQEAIAVPQLISDSIIDLFTMSGSFTADQIKLLYDYRFVDEAGDNEVVVRFEELAGGYLLLGDDPRVVFPDLGGSYSLDEVLTIDMMRFIQVDLADGSDPVVVYLRDCDTAPVEDDLGETVQAVFYDTVADLAGINDPGFNKYLYDFWIVAADEFISKWSYGHGHFDRMYIVPFDNEGFTTDFGAHSVGEYGGRASTKAVYEIRLVEVPQEAPSIQVVSMIDGETLIWGTNANDCEGCHWKNDELHLPEIDCLSCHATP